MKTKTRLFGTVRDLNPAEQLTIDTVFRSYRGAGPLFDLYGFEYRVGDAVTWNGQSWIVYDMDADNNAPGGALACLVTPDYKKIVQGVNLDDISTR